MTFQILQYGTLIAVFLIMIASYNKYKKGEFSLENESIENPSTFKQWSKEIFIIRPRKRPLLSLIPQMGIIISLVFIVFFLQGLFLYMKNPFLPFDELKRYDGQIIDYKHNKKISDKLIVKLDNGEIKYFSTELPKKEEMKEWLNKKIIVWTQPDWYFSSSEQIAWEYVSGVKNYHYIDFGDPNRIKQFYTIENAKEHYKLHYEKFRKFLKNDEYRLYTSLKFLLFFFFLLWFVNRNPVTTNLKEVENGNN